MKKIVSILQIVNEEKLIFIIIKSTNTAFFYQWFRAVVFKVGSVDPQGSLRGL